MTSEVQQKIDALGRRLGRSVVLNDPDIRLVLASEHFGDEDPVRVRAMLHRDAGGGPIGYLLSHGITQWTRAGRVPASAEHELLSRLVVPVRRHGELLGFLVVIDADESLSDDDVALVEQLAQDAAGLIVAERHAQDERARAQEQHLTAWLGTDAGERSAAERALTDRGVLPLPRHLRVLVLEPVGLAGGVEDDQVDLALRHALEAAPRAGRESVLHAVAGRRGILVLASPVEIDDAAAEARADALMADLDAFAAGRFGARVGVGAEVLDPDRAWTSYRQAVLACRAVPALGAGRTARWDQLGPLGLLLRIPPDELDETAVPPAIGQLEAADPHGRLLETLEVFLDRGGSGSAAAERLHVHRTTLYYRLDRIREITGLDLDDGRVRLELHLGLLVRRLLAAG
ncbi:helix-turn-helix domain-containing protein [Nocardioides sp. YIM 152588]|uniref:PucR family transcriptional regulator n=1 Tax=Nocardioides sp. YIM 152588 TaxID=3158259 RepID=UPI0032E39C67